jgi:hypothetical protein
LSVQCWSPGFSRCLSVFLFHPIQRTG